MSSLESRDRWLHCILQHFECAAGHGICIAVTCQEIPNEDPWLDPVQTPKTGWPENCEELHCMDKVNVISTGASVS